MFGSLFNRQAAKPVSEAEQALQGWGIKYEKKPDGSILVPGDLNLYGKGLTRLPDLSSVTVTGDFSCNNNRLTSLVGAPQSVTGGFYCNNNQLTSLEHAPHTVGGDFSCNHNQLTSLEHAPHTVGGGFYCYHNQLTSLEHAPHTVTDDFWCSYNPLTSLEHAPQKFNTLYSDLGEFSAWDAVPEELRTSPETRARLEQERLTAATVLQSAMRISAPLKLRSKASITLP